MIFLPTTVLSGSSSGSVAMTSNGMKMMMKTHDDGCQFMLDLL